MEAGKESVTVIILTYDEEKHIKRCIRSVKSFAEKIIIIDSFSTDKTKEISEKEGAAFYQHEFINQAAQFNWALDNISIDTEWVMRLDADEYPMPELVDEIKKRLPNLDSETTGINLKRRHIFMGRWIKYGTRYPLVMLRIWRNGKAYVEPRWMDEHVALKSGKMTNFKYDFCDHNLNNIGWWVEKHNNYASREAVDVLKKKYKLIELEDEVCTGHVSIQAAFKRLVKENIYNKVPFFLGPFLYIIYRYILRFGFLDGKEGLIYHFLQGFWYRFLVEVKVCEVEARMKRENIECEEAIRREFLMDPFFT